MFSYIYQGNTHTDTSPAYMQQLGMDSEQIESVLAQQAYESRKVVPPAVTRRQARQHLLIAGLLPAVEPAIAAIADDMTRQMVQIYWEDSTAFERNNPYLIQLASALGLDDNALDDAFIAAAKL